METGSFSSAAWIAAAVISAGLGAALVLVGILARRLRDRTDEQDEQIAAENQRQDREDDDRVHDPG